MAGVFAATGDGFFFCSGTISSHYKGSQFNAEKAENSHTERPEMHPEPDHLGPRSILPAQPPFWYVNVGLHTGSGVYVFSSTPPHATCNIIK